jgi:hypothetical protein
MIAPFEEAVCSKKRENPVVRNPISPFSKTHFLELERRGSSGRANVLVQPNSNQLESSSTCHLTFATLSLNQSSTAPRRLISCGDNLSTRA